MGIIMAKFTPWVFLLVLVIAIVVLYQRSQHLQRSYRQEVVAALATLNSKNTTIELLTETELVHLPEQVQHNRPS